MKYLLVIILALAVIWLWRHNRQAEKSAAPPPARAKPQPEKFTEMVQCEVCHVHLPRSDALIGRKGCYCSEAHRRQAGG